MTIARIATSSPPNDWYTPMATAFGYIRVSTQGQKDDGVSLDTQTAKIQAWSDLNGYDFGGIFDDAGVSGHKTDRAGLMAAIAQAKRGDALVVYSLSRFARNTRHTLEMAEMLDRKGVDLVSLSEKIDTTTAAGKMVFRMMAVLSEFERDQIAERTSAAMQFKKSQGHRVGSIPYGKRLAEDGVALIDDEVEQEVLHLVRVCRNGGMTYQAIGAELEARGFKPRGKGWHAQTIKNIAKAA